MIEGKKREKRWARQRRSVMIVHSVQQSLKAFCGGEEEYSTKLPYAEFVQVILVLGRTAEGCEDA